MCKYFPELKNTEIQAFGGLTVERLMYKLDNDRISNLSQFCNIIIHVGTNDIFYTTSDRYFETIVSIVNSIKSVNSSCKIILSGVLPRPTDFRFSDILIREFNSKLVQCADNDTRVVFMPVNKSYYDRYGRPIFPLFSDNDLLHLNHAGIQKFVHFIANFLAHLY